MVFLFLKLVHDGLIYTHLSPSCWRSLALYHFHDFSKMRNRYKEEQNSPESPAYKYVVAHGRGRSQVPYQKLDQIDFCKTKFFSYCVLSPPCSIPKSFPVLQFFNPTHSYVISKMSAFHLSPSLLTIP